jgi:hypothetical protein
MRHEHPAVTVCVAAIVIVASLSSDAAATPAVIVSGDASIVVRTYTQAGSATDMAAARHTASDILGRAGIRVAWLECGAPGDGSTAAPACNEPLRSNELVVRIVPAGSADSQPRAGSLGFAFIDPDAGGGWLATVYADRVATMAQAAGADRAELLGRAMAHEIGHLLIGSNAHARHGLMRASWSGADLRRNRATEWLFGGSEREVMRKRIASR